MATWRKLIATEMKKHGESQDDAQDWATNYKGEGGWLDAEFDDGYGGPEGCHFTVWTKKRVYFPVVYNGGEWASSVSREPDRVATEHIGGW